MPNNNKKIAALNALYEWFRHFVFKRLEIQNIVD